MALLLLSFSDPYTIKRITDANFKYEFYTTQKEIKAKPDRDYYWFKGGAIHHAGSGVSGEALNDSYVKLFLNNQLAEKGTFKNGLKTGVWKSWFPNGKLQTVETWKNGFMKGDFLRYDIDGNLLESGNYKNNLKQGKWIDHTKKDTLNYKKGIVRIKLTKAEKAAAKAERKLAKEKKATETQTAPQAGKKNFFQRLFQKKAKPEATTPQAKEKKDNFFKRLFRKKEPQQKQ